MRAASYIQGVTWPLWFYLGIPSSAWKAADEEYETGVPMADVHQLAWKKAEGLSSLFYREAARKAQGVKSRREQDALIEKEVRRLRVLRNPFIKQLRGRTRTNLAALATQTEA